MAEDKHSKKHPVSAKKKKDLKKKGTVAKSQDVPMALGLVAAFVAMLALRKPFMERYADLIPWYVSQIRDPESIVPGQLILRVLIDIAWLSMPVLLAVLVMAFIANIAQSGLIITGEQLKPDFKKINPVNKLKQWFSIKSAQELFKSLGKILLASYLGYIVFKDYADDIQYSMQLDAAQLLGLGAEIIRKLFIFIIILYVVIAAIDFGFQKKNFATEHKMTDKEVKDEYKNTEGDPYQKGKRRQMAQQIAMQSAQEHVPQADAVVINPTQLAIALKYDPEVSPVPWVLAKGEVGDADAIRESALAAGVPVVRNKPLARALFTMCEIGDIVPEDLYRPVAEILAYVFQLREQTLADSNDAAQASAITAHANDAAQAAQRLEAGTDGVHDLQAISVPVDPSQPAVSAEAAGAMQAEPSRFSWR